MPDRKTRLIERLARNGLLDNPSLAGQWLMDRSPTPLRREIMDELFPMLRVAANAA